MKTTYKNNITIRKEQERRNLMATFSTNKSKLIVIKSKGNSGKTTTIWMTYLELLNKDAKVLSFSGTYGGNP